MKKILAIILVIVSIISCFSVIAGAEESETIYLGRCGWSTQTGEYLYAKIQNGCLVVYGIGDQFYYNLPWVKYKDIITSIVVDGGVQSINNSAFEGLENVRVATIADSVRLIGGNSFKDCVNLKDIIIAEDVEYVGGNAFYNTAFYNDSNNWEDGVLYLQSCLISAKDMVDSTYSIRNGTKVIAYEAFRNNKYLSNIIIPDSVEYICNGAFYGCNGLTQVNLPNTIKEMWNFAFMYCQNLTNINIPTSMSVLRNQVFSCCYSLKEVNIPASIQEIGSTISPFSKMYSVQNISVDEDNEYFYEKGNCLIEKSTGRIVLGCVNSVIPEDSNVTTIGTDAFSGAEITSISIPKNITTIEDSAFYSCLKLEEIYIPSTVISLGANVFWECRLLKKAILDCNISKLPGGLFYGCWHLKDVKLPENITQIPNSVFYYCAELTDINIPASVTQIGYCSFGKCGKLKNIYFSGDESAWNNINYNSASFEECHDYLVHYNSTKETHETYKRNTSTCTQNGVIEYYCDCGYVLKTDPSTATGHSYTATTIKPTCITKGYTHYVCSFCGNTYDDNIINEIGHNYTSTITNPTCTSDGCTTHICTECGDMYTDNYIPAYGHNYKTVITPSTCTSQGYTTYTCVNCGDNYVADYTDETEHTAIIINEKDATYDSTGYTGDIYCTSCNSIIEYGKEIPKLEKEKKSLSWIVGHIANFIIKVFGYLRGFNLI